ncbi:unnamed protein product [Polarella glacialis]|uniref:Sulfotransferase domain-containing protein n=1 Tax=Polarella glacialis TaxID=89957 RepID=A0A813H3L7_POLGL|nr:unnamed protein product [Polarella glacialis]
MAEGHLSGSAALYSGRLIIRGDTMVAMEFGSLLESVWPKPKAPPRSAAAISKEDRDTLHVQKVCLGLLLLLLLVVGFLVLSSPASKERNGPPHLEKVARMQSGMVLDKYPNLKPLMSFNSRITSKLQDARKFKALPTDVFLVDFMGGGSHLLSQMAHGLLSNGSLAFSDIAEVVPWIEAAHSVGQAVDGPQAFSPRLFSSHHLRPQLPEKARYVFLVREPMDVLASQWLQYSNGTWAQYGGVENAHVTLELFAAAVFAHKSSDGFWKHLLSWYHCCWHDPDVLWLAYEDLVEQPAASIAKLAEFLRIDDLGPELFSLVEAQTTQQFMLEHASYFDDHFVLHKLSPGFQELPWGSSQHVQPAAEMVKVGHDDVPLLVNARWSGLVTPATGLHSYSDLRAAIERRQGTPLGESIAAPGGGLPATAALRATRGVGGTGSFSPSSSWPLFLSVLGVACFAFRVAFWGLSLAQLRAVVVFKCRRALMGKRQDPSLI